MLFDSALCCACLVACCVVRNNLPQRRFRAVCFNHRTRHPNRLRLARRVAWAASLLAVPWFVSIPAQAALIGSTVYWQYYAYGGPYGIPHEFVVNGAVGDTFHAGRDRTYFDIVVDDDSLQFNYAPLNDDEERDWDDSVLSLAPTIHNGIAIDLPASVSFENISINAETNMEDFDASRFSFTKRQLQVDWTLLKFTKATKVSFDIVVVPELNVLPGDANNDGVVDLEDINTIRDHFGEVGPGDLDGDGIVDAADLALLLGAWGAGGAADLDGDGVVGASDLALLLGAWSA